MKDVAPQIVGPGSQSFFLSFFRPPHQELESKLSRSPPSSLFSPRRLFRPLFLTLFFVGSVL